MLLISHHIGCMLQLTNDVIRNGCSIHCRRCCQVSNLSWSTHGQTRTVTLVPMESIHDDKNKSTLYQICHCHHRLVWTSPPSPDLKWSLQGYDMVENLRVIIIINVLFSNISRTFLSYRIIMFYKYENWKTPGTNCSITLVKELPWNYK